MRWTEAARVGLAVVLAAGALLGTMFVLNRSRQIGDAQSVQVSFDNVQGVTPGAAVLLRGVRVGEVIDVDLDEDGRPLLSLLIAGKVPLSRKDGFRIATAALSFSPPNIEILPDYYAGTPQAEITEGPYRGVGGAGAEELFRQSRDLLMSVTQLTDRVTEVVGSLAEFTDNPAVREGLITTTKNFTLVSESGVRIAKGMEVTVGQVGRLVAQFDTTAARLDEALEGANALIAEFQGAAANTKGITEDARELVANASGLIEDSRGLVRETQSAVTETKATVTDTRERVGKLFDNLDRSIATLNQTLLEAQDLIGDDETRAEFKATLANLREASASLAAISNDVRGVTSDPEVQQDLKAAIAGLRDATEQASETFRRVNDLLGKTKKKSDKVKGNLRQISYNVETTYSFRNHRARVDANLLLPWTGRTFFTTGLYDLGEGSRLNLQMGREVVKGAHVRYGFYAGKLGFGTDFGPRSRPYLFMNVFGVEDPQVDVRARLPLFYGLDFSFGLDDVTDKSRPILGFEYRR